MILRPQLIREIEFDIEKKIFLSDKKNQTREYIFITSLARSGTTILLNSIYKSGKFASLTYDDMPFILAPNLWSKIKRNYSNSIYQERAHNDGIKISSDSPEAFEEVFWNTFSYNNELCETNFKEFIELILIKNNSNRYLSKNNQNIKRLNRLVALFPNSIILVPFRNPLQQSFSLLNQHKKFIEHQINDKFVREYMDLIKHSEFGMDYSMVCSSNLKYLDTSKLNHWLEQWYLTYKNILNNHSNHRNINLICYESLCEIPEVWKTIKELLQIDDNIVCKFEKSEKVITQKFDLALAEKCQRLYCDLAKNCLGT